ncbi:hypothetical protein ACFWNR_18360 [Streptomyces virginiae]|uniref:hypothetical protein n=1 Tax=Streptomyces virginiae TaxID=1961 RepID=UPI00364FDFCC
MSSNRDDIQPTTLPGNSNIDDRLLGIGPRQPAHHRGDDGATREEHSVVEASKQAADVASHGGYVNEHFDPDRDDAEVEAELAQYFAESDIDPAGEEVQAARLAAVLMRAAELGHLREAKRDPKANIAEAGAGEDKPERAHAPRKPCLFVSLRRSDAGTTGILVDTMLRREFGDASTFRDNRSLPKGAQLPDLRSWLLASDVLLVIMGRGWLTTADAKGRRCLDDEHDFVRKELALAFQCRLAVIPVLVDGAVMPAPSELPEDIAALAERQAFTLRSVEADAGALFETIRKAFTETSTMWSREDVVSLGNGDSGAQREAAGHCQERART